MDEAPFSSVIGKLFGHGVQSVRPKSDVYEPSGQGMQVVEPA